MELESVKFFLFNNRLGNIAKTFSFLSVPHYSARLFEENTTFGDIPWPKPGSEPVALSLCVACMHAT